MRLKKDERRLFFLVINVRHTHFKLILKSDEGKDVVNFNITLLTAKLSL